MPPPRGAGPGALRTLLGAASDEWRATPFYRMMLRGQDPDRISQWGKDPRTGDVARGVEILRGQWRICSERLAGEHRIPWGAPPPSPHFSARLHSFSWLVDVAGAGGESRDAIADLIQSWVEGFGEWHPHAWAPELVAERLFAWLCHGRVAFETGDAAARPALMRAFGRQARHLMLAAQDLRDPLARIKAGAALTLAGAADPIEGDRQLDLGAEMLAEAAASQFFSDGGHLSRCPAALVEALADFMTADDALVRRGLETPRLIRELMPKMAGMLRYFRFADGGLAGFNGGGEAEPATIARLIAEFESDIRPFRIAPQSGFHRLEAGDTVLILDAGAAPPAAFGERAHAGCLSFELSCGLERLIVNVGSHRELLPDWRAAGRATNGHSTLVVDDGLSAVFEQARLQRGAARPSGPPGVSAKRTDDEDGAWVEAQHEGYRADYGLTHRRTIYMNADGADIRGLDVLSRPLVAGRATDLWRPPFAIRFHLHPAVTAERVDAGVVRLETGAGAHWRLRTDAERIAIENSIYLSGPDGPQRARQVVLYGEADPNGTGEFQPNRVRWALTRIDAPAG